MHNFEVFQLPFHLGCLDRLQIQHEEKSFIVGASSMMPVLASIWGAFLSVTFKLPFHALPLLSPHPASFRSFTPWASSSSALVKVFTFYDFCGNLWGKNSPWQVKLCNHCCFCVGLSWSETMGQAGPQLVQLLCSRQCPASFQQQVGHHWLFHHWLILKMFHDAWGDSDMLLFWPFLTILLQ